MDRGYGRWRILSLDPDTDKTTTLVDDHPPTFVDSTAQFTQFLEGSDEIIYTSEQDGWHHLYLSDGKGGSSQITRGAWVVRGVTKVDEANRQIVFSASGMNAGEDPYFIHYYRIDFDGAHLVSRNGRRQLGNHTAPCFRPMGKPRSWTPTRPCLTRRSHEPEECRHGVRYWRPLRRQMCPIY